MRAKLLPRRGNNSNVLKLEKLQLIQLGAEPATVLYVSRVIHGLVSDLEPWRVEVVVRLILDCGNGWRENPQELETVFKFIGFSFVAPQIQQRDVVYFKVGQVR